ncbi:MAG: DUF5666 domain-containing protein [Pseudomonadota bacterium]
MNTSKLAAALACLTIAACGGGGSDPDSVAGIDGRGAPVAAKAQGTIASFGSIVVNGVRYDTSSATFEVDGTAGSESDLAVGDVVTVTGTIAESGTTGTANSVQFDDIVEGPVAAVDTAANTITVLGQTVQVSADTSFDDNISPASIDGVMVGMIIEVSGFRLSDGTISATRIEAKPAGGEFEVTGLVSNLSATTFQIAALTVDYSGAQLDDFPAGSIQDGQRVEAKGTTLGAGGELIATRVEFKGDNLGVDDGDQVEIEGFITRFASDADFDVSGSPVTTNASTIYEGGTAADLGLNIKVEVEGVADANGVIVATKVDIRRAKAVRATALVDSVDAANASVVLLGITVNTDELTRIEDKSSADVEPLTIGDINVGDYVEVRGDEFPAGSGDILATIFEREDPDPEASLQGFVETMNDPNFTILGVTIETNGGTVFRDENNVVISSTEFFNRLAINDLVKAEGSEVSDTTIVATEVEIELEL